ncbi:hypothetical protein M0D69_21925 [Caballeronia sp. SEWSISQ10-4 2]|nr:hypothetical protein [Caballeronia sp. SEWSISQ10-4 2]
MNLKQMTVKAKLSAGFGVLAAIVMVVSGLSVKSLNDSTERFSSMSRASARALTWRSVFGPSSIGASSLLITSYY